MESNNTKTALLIGAVVVVLVALGAWAWSMNQDTANNDTNNNTANEESQMNEETALKDIVDTAVATDSLSTLVKAVTAAGLVDTLKGEGPFTVFAPTNDAFAKLPEGTLESLLLPENKEQLASLLTYHVVSGEVMSSSLQNGQVVTTVNGGTLTVELMDGKAYLVDAKGGKAMVTTADVKTTNGVVHIIDAVVMPQ
jgi:uncharacterized surface protein with fasciclin (FAS1) repeats